MVRNEQDEDVIRLLNECEGGKILAWATWYTNASRFRTWNIEQKYRNTECFIVPNNGRAGKFFEYPNHMCVNLTTAVSDQKLFIRQL